VTQRLKGFSWLMAVITLSIALAVGFPYIANVIPWSVEKRAATYTELFPKGICADNGPTEASRLFDKVVQRLYPRYPGDGSFPLRVQVVRGPTVNAFAGLGGEVFVYEGLLKRAESADELAGILTHEIEHVRRRHVMEGILVRLSTTQALAYIFTGGRTLGPEIARMTLNSRFTRAQEREADEGGLQRLQDAHVDVRGLEHFFQRMQASSTAPSFLSDHPADEDRAALVRQYETGPVEPLLTKEEWTTVQGICRS
jgi:beta-barrel assembly-enhancing protease